MKLLAILSITAIVCFIAFLIWGAETLGKDAEQHHKNYYK